MKFYLLDNIAKDVRVSLDQNMVSDALTEIGDVDTLSVDEIICSKILEGVKQIHGIAPVHLLDSGYNFGDAIYWNELESGWVLLPDDFMRLVVFEMDDWSRPVYRAIGFDDPSYAKLSSRFKGIRGTAQRPVCAIGIRPEGRVLEFYSCKSEEAKVSRAVYIPYPKEENGGVEICERCYDAVVYMTAALVLTAFGDVDRSNVFMELSKSVLV